MRNFVVGVENRGMSSLDENERNNSIVEDTRAVDMKALNPEPLPPLPFLTATSILGGNSLENNRAQAGNKRVAGTRVEGLDIDNPLYNYTENCNRYDNICIQDKSAILVVLCFPSKLSINRPEKMINIEREKYALPLPEKKPEEEDVYVYQVAFQQK